MCQSLWLTLCVVYGSCAVCPVGAPCTCAGCSVCGCPWCSLWSLWVLPVGARSGALWGWSCAHGVQCVSVRRSGVPRNRCAAGALRTYHHGGRSMGFLLSIIWTNTVGPYSGPWWTPGSTKRESGGARESVRAGKQIVPPRAAYHSAPRHSSRLSPACAHPALPLPTQRHTP